MNTKTYISTFVTELQTRLISSLLIVILITFSALALALYLDDQYKSQALLKHSEDSLNNGFAPSSPIGGIAALGGINLGQGSIDPIDYSIEVIKSREFLSHLLKIGLVKANLVAIDYYDPKKQKIFYDTRIYDLQNNKWQDELKKFKKVEPNVLEVHKKYYLENLTLTKNRTTGFLLITFQHESPIFAKEFIDLIIEEFNKIERREDLDESQKKMAFLMQRNSETLNQEVKQAVSQLMENELKKIAYSSTKIDYMLEVIDPAYLPNKADFPSRLIIIALALMLSILLVLIRIHIIILLK
tara:strand:+ start:1007 stop:1903 length:897 start_codon:yes stop_codon:yes gene_type:complete